LSNVLFLAAVTIDMLITPGLGVAPAAPQSVSDRTQAVDGSNPAGRLRRTGTGRSVTRSPGQSPTNSDQRRRMTESGRVPRSVRRGPRALPGRDPDRAHPRQLLAAQRRRGTRLGGRQQRRARLHAALRLLAEPDRAAVQRPPLLLPRRHRSPRPRNPEPPDQQLHRLAQRPPRRPQAQTPHPARTRPQSRPGQHGKRCLTLH
jgi:hypothetical protein